MTSVTSITLLMLSGFHQAEDQACHFKKRVIAMHDQQPFTLNPKSLLIERAGQLVNATEWHIHTRWKLMDY